LLQQYRYSRTTSVMENSLWRTRDYYSGSSGFLTMASSSRNIHIEDYIRFLNDQYQFQNNEQDAKHLLHERGLVM
ncbi:hypothetical protein HAX54_037960, partial [Datura stramonium]|nr:hypothetical protein [Datura stramonium]